MHGPFRMVRGYIPNAVQLHRDHDLTEENLLEIVRKDQEVVLYSCGKGWGVTARRVATAVSIGFERVYYFRDRLPE